MSRCRLIVELEGKKFCLEDIGVAYEAALGKGDVSHVLDGGVAGASSIEFGSPRRGLDKVFCECGFFGPDTPAEGHTRGRRYVVRGDYVDSGSADALVLDLHVRLSMQILGNEVSDRELRLAVLGEDIEYSGLRAQWGIKYHLPFDMPFLAFISRRLRAELYTSNFQDKLQPYIPQFLFEIYEDVISVVAMRV